MIILKLIQTSKYQWTLKSPTDKIMVEMAFASQYKAEEWVKAFISGQPTWGYEIVVE